MTCKSHKVSEILSKMQSDHEKSLFKPLFKVTCTIEIRYPIRVPYFYYTNQKKVTGLEGERKENSPVDCFPRESYAKF